MAGFSRNVALFALSCLLGGLLLFLFVVDPTLANPNVTSGLSGSMRGAISGAIVHRFYPITYLFGGTAAFFLLLACFAGGPAARGPRRALVFGILLLGLNAADDLYISRRINQIKVRIANPQQVDSAREDLKQWQQIGTIAFAATTACCLLGALFLLPAGSAAGAKGKGGKK